MESVEKRRFRRVPLTLPVSGKCLQRIFRGRRFHGETRDVSFSGLCLRIASGNGYKVGQRVKLKTRLYEGDFSIKVQGVVCWIKGQDHGKWPVLMGVRLTKIRRLGLWCERIEQKLPAAS